MSYNRYIVFNPKMVKKKTEIDEYEEFLKTQRAFEKKQRLEILEKNKTI